jgi:hypothetical protein
MGDETARTKAIVTVFSRPSDFSQEADWDAWYDEQHVPATAAAGSAWVVTRWETTQRPAGFSEPVGFTHLAVYELEDPGTAGQLLDRLDGRRSGDDVHPVHTIIGVDVLTPVGRWNEKAEPHAGLPGQVFAYVGPNDPTREAEWHEWYDAVHVPDMMGSGAFSGTTRWRRALPARFGPNFFTLYDVSLPTVDEAVRRSGEAMGPAAAAGRLLDCHAGGLRSSLHPAGRYGAAGFRTGG